MSLAPAPCTCDWPVNTRPCPRHGERKVRDLARPTVSEEAIEAAAREIVKRVRRPAVLPKTDAEERAREILRRHFGASE